MAQETLDPTAYTDLPLDLSVMEEILADQSSYGYEPEFLRGVEE